MAIMGTAAVTELWSKCKTWFGRRLGVSTTSTTASIQLKNNAGDNLGDAATIGAASSSAAGVMTADMYTKLDGIATGATANTGTVTSVATGAGLAGGPVTGSGTIKASLRNETKLSNDSAAATETSGRVYPVAVDKSGYLAVNVPWTDTDTNTHYESKTVVGASNSAVANAEATNGSVYMNHVENGVVQSAHKIVGTGSTSVTSDASGNITISSADATNGTVTSVATGVGLSGGPITDSGTVKANLVSETKLTRAASAATETAGRVYPVALDKDGKLAVNVPWTDNDTKALESMTGTLGLAHGGTGATSAAEARTSLDVYSKNEVDSLITTGAAFHGTVGTSGADYTQAQIESSSYKAGWYWVVKTAGTFVGQACEVGDMVYAVKSKASAYSASDFTVVQNNLTEMTAAEVDAICV